MAVVAVPLPRHDQQDQQDRKHAAPLSEPTTKTTIWFVLALACFTSCFVLVFRETWVTCSGGLKVLCLDNAEPERVMLVLACTLAFREHR